MDALAVMEIFLFEDFRLDRRAGGLFRADENGVLVPVAIGSRALDLLTLLVRRHGDLVSKDEIMAAVWPEIIVEDSNLPTQISALRRVLDIGRSNGSCIQTVAGRGYRFVAAVTHPVAEAHLGRPSMITDGHGEDRRLDLSAPFTIDPGARRRILRSVLGAATSPRHLAALLTSAIAAVLALGVSAWWLWPTTKLSSPPELTAASSISQPLAAPRLSITVLPFANLSNDPDQQYFADGITDDLTTDLSRITDMFVIARNTAFTYRNKPIDAKQIGRELGVRYVLEGSVQRSGNQVRINAQLIDAETNAHLWAERFDRDTSDLFALQNEITTMIAAALRLELISTEAERRTEHPDVLEYILRARAVYTKPISRENHAKAISLFERALALDPHSGEAQSWLAYVLAGRVLANMTDSPAADIERASQLSAQAVASLPRSPVAHEARGEVLRAERRYAEAIPEYETVLALDRNWVYAYFALGQCKLQTGSIEEAIPLVERAIRLSPREPALAVWYEQIGNVFLLQSRTEEAVMWLEKARDKNPEHSMIRADLAAAYGLAGQTERAAVELAEARRLSPTDRYASLARLRAVMNYGVPKIRTLREATYFVGMRTAGMPEE
jgi:TolB-like protein/DNA-binding winged helix-turn-helix (wHTH) protein/Tfp pilus assembly protein PilF